MFTGIKKKKDYGQKGQVASLGASTHLMQWRNGKELNFLLASQPPVKPYRFFSSSQK